MADAQVLTGWCYLCNTAVESDVLAHFNQNHQTPATKPKVPMLSWEHRTRNVLSDLSQILDESDRGRQIQIIDGVLQELYLVRARLGEMKRAKEGN